MGETAKESVNYEEDQPSIYLMLRSCIRRRLKQS